MYLTYIADCGLENLSEGNEDQLDILLFSLTTTLLGMAFLTVIVFFLLAGPLFDILPFRQERSFDGATLLMVIQYVGAGQRSHL